MSYYSSEMARIMAEHLPKPETIQPVIRARRMIEKHACEGIDLDMMASEACLSKFHFSRLFRRCYGCTPHQYLTERRIEEAKGLLARGASVEEACFGTGFASVPSFALLFRRQTGMAPRVFRARAVQGGRAWSERPGGRERGA
ncbi:MAG TPA: AraC family transcriptional regulator [Puia sp.]|nr:AraC family transcriptional regulator [Puia sp.]